MSDTAHPVAGTVRWIERAVELDATRIAYGLKLPAERLAAATRRGLVYGSNECGIAEDDGCFFLTFRYLGRALRLVVTRLEKSAASGAYEPGT